MNACRLSGFFVLSLIVCLVALGVSEKPPSTVVVISANAEWHPFRGLFPEARIEQSPFGEYFVHDLDVGGGVEKVVFLHGGWGKISAAASAQFAIDRWSPRLLVNLGTCGAVSRERSSREKSCSWRRPSSTTSWKRWVTPVKR